MKVFIVSTIYPSGHYTEYLAKGFKKYRKNRDTVTIIADKNPSNPTHIKNVSVVNVWNKDLRFIFQITNYIIKNKPNLVHIQHEINMFGGILTSVLFPALLLLVKILGFKLVITIHATVSPTQINSGFLKTFHFKQSKATKILVKIFFKYIYLSMIILGDTCIVHSDTAKNILESYKDNKKTVVIRHPIHDFKYQKSSRDKGYFLYFGYMARRKGLEDIIASYKKLGWLKKGHKLILAGGVIKGQETTLIEIKKVIKKYNLGRDVKYLGKVDDKQQANLYKNAYVCLVPSKLAISSSGPLCHALGHHKCIIASNTPYIKEDIQDLYSGLLVKKNNWLYQMKLVCKNPRIVKEIEANTVKLVAKRTSLVIASQHLNIYRELQTK